MINKIKIFTYWLIILLLTSCSTSSSLYQKNLTPEIRTEYKKLVEDDIKKKEYTIDI